VRHGTDLSTVARKATESQILNLLQTITQRVTQNSKELFGA